jgi:hypothetical protein
VSGGTFDLCYMDAVKKCATKMFNSSEDVENLANLPFTQIEFLVYAFNGWKD